MLCLNGDFLKKIIDKPWAPVRMSACHSAVNAYALNYPNAIEPDCLILCETLSILDKRRIRIRSPVQIINTLEFNICISYPTSIDELSNDYSSSSVHWTESIIKAGKKWCLPLNTISQNRVNYFRISPILRSVI